MFDADNLEKRGASGSALGRTTIEFGSALRVLLRRGARWLLVHGKGGKDRREPFDADLAVVLSAYLLTERGESSSPALFLVAKGRTRGQRLSPAGLHTIRY